MLTVGRFLVVDSQFVTGGGDDIKALCRDGQDCRLISRCPAVLKLVFKVKAGDPGAREELLQAQCGFEKSLPKVCCGGGGGEASDRPRIFPDSVTVPSSSSKTDPSPFTTSTTT